MPSGGGSSSTPASQTVTQTSEPWAGQTPYLTELYKSALNAYNAVPQGAYTGDLVAKPTAAQQTGISLSKDLAGSLVNAGAPAINLGQANISGAYLNPATNPYLSGTIQAAIDPVEEKYRNILRDYTTGAINTGSYGGTRDAYNVGQIAGTDFGREATNAAMTAAYQNYLNERNIQLQSPNLISAGAQLSSLAPQTYTAVGGQEQQFTQNLLDEAYKKYVQQVQAPYIGLPEYASLVAGTGFPGGTTTSTGTFAPSGASSGANFLSGALGGASIGSVFGPWGAGIGAVGGGLLSLFA